MPWKAMCSPAEWGRVIKIVASMLMVGIIERIPMSVIECFGLVAACGAAGGLTTCFHKDSVTLPKYDRKTKIWKPGAIGTVLIGAIAAMLVWAMYGSAATHDFSNLATGSSSSFSLTVAQLASSFLTGLTGGRVLVLFAQQNADQFTKKKLSDKMKDIMDITKE